MKLFSQKYLKECLDYNPLTGDIFWKERPLSHFKDERAMKKWNTRYSFKKAGYKVKVYKSDSLEYWRLSLDNHPYDAHKIIWVWVHGEYATLIDHIDGDGLNNKLLNLREASVSQNVRKGKIQRNNTSGHKGVSFRKDTNKWSVRLKVNGSYKSLGSYSDKEYASKVYVTAVLITEGEVFSETVPFSSNSTEYQFVQNKLL